MILCVLRDMIDFRFSVIIWDNCPVSLISFLASLNGGSWAPLACGISHLLLGNSDLSLEVEWDEKWVGPQNFGTGRDLRSVLRLHYPDEGPGEDYSDSPRAHSKLVAAWAPQSGSSDSLASVLCSTPPRFLYPFLLPVTTQHDLLGPCFHLLLLQFLVPTEGRKGQPFRRCSLLDFLLIMSFTNSRTLSSP